MTVVINGTSGITDVNGTAAAPAITGTDTDTGVFFGTNTVSLSTGGTERLQIDSSGNAGLGVTPLNAYTGSGFKAYELPKANIYSFDLGSRPIAGFSVNSYLNSSAVAKYIATGYATLYESDQGQHRFYTAPSGTAGNTITFTQAMTLDASGNLLIGATSGSYPLLVKKAASSSDNSTVSIVSGTAGYAQVLLGDTASDAVGYLAYNNSTNALEIATNGSERARIDSSGNLLVGTTSTTQSHKMVGLVANAWALQVISSFATGSQNYGINAAFSASTPNNSSNYFFQGNDTNVNRFIVYSNGGIANYSANNTNLSDSREKTNVNPASNYLAKICAIPVRTYNYIDQNLEEDAGLTLGVFAQDVQEVAPELVMESNWGTQEEPKMRLSIYQTDLQYALMKCIQEQQAIIEQLQADVAALKGQA